MQDLGNQRWHEWQENAYVSTKARMSDPEPVQLKFPSCGGDLQQGWLSTMMHWPWGGFRWEDGRGPTMAAGELLALFSRR